MFYFVPGSGLLERIYPRSGITASASSSDKTVVTKTGPNVTYYPSNVLDGDHSTAWVEGKKGHGIGEWIVLRFDEPIRVSRLRIWNGYQKYKNDRLQDRYEINERLKRIRVVTDHEDRSFTLEDTRKAQELILGSNEVQFVRIEIRSVYEAEYPDCAIADIVVLYLSD
ncbi:MAG: hypothetical protein ABIK09_08385 [Pseudomonadota bacterium]